MRSRSSLSLVAKAALAATLTATLAVGTLALSSAPASAHCQVPCGIYDDHARVHAMFEDVTTVDKAVAQITALAGKGDAQSVNQATRWVMTKDKHAAHIQQLVADYFLAQRVKPAPKGDAAAWKTYVAKLVALHRVTRAAMKVKQTVDPAAVAELRAAVGELETWWPPHDHGKGHHEGKHKGR